MHPTVPNQSHDSIGDDYAGHGEELGCASRPDGPPGRARSRKCGPLGARTRSCPCLPKSAERTQRHASEWPNLSGRTVTASAKLCVKLPISGVGLPRTQRLAPPIGPSTINFGNFVHLGFRVQPLAGNPTSNSTACDAISYTPEQGIYFVLAGN